MNGGTFAPEVKRSIASRILDPARKPALQSIVSKGVSVPERNAKRGVVRTNGKFPRPVSGTVVSLAVERGRRKLRGYESRIRIGLDSNRTTMGLLFKSGLLFTRQGTRAGRDLLLLHQHLLKVADVLSTMSLVGGTTPREQQTSAEMYSELDSLLAKSAQLAQRTDEYLATVRE